MSLYEGQGTKPFAKSRLEDMSYTKTRSCELHSQVEVWCGDLNLFPQLVEMFVYESFLQSIEDHNLSFTKLDRQLLKVTKASQGIDLSLQSLWSRGQQDQVIGKEE